MFEIAATNYSKLHISIGSAILQGEGNASMYTESDGQWELTCTFNMVSCHWFGKLNVHLGLSLYRGGEWISVLLHSWEGRKSPHLSGHFLLPQWC